MSDGKPKGNAIMEIFSGTEELRKEPWASLWMERAIQYFFLFDIVLIGGFLLFWIFNLFPTNSNNALYFLSAMVQAQAAIVSLVITLTLVAIQMATASYTPRVVDVMKKNPDMWYLLTIYLIAISYGFFTLKQVAPNTDRFLVSSILILGIYTFSILFLYMKNTIAMLRPDTVVSMLVAEISADNLKESIAQIQRYYRITEHTKNVKQVQDAAKKEDVLQPIFDVVHASMMRFDVTTTRTGLSALSDRLLELFAGFDETGRKEIAGDISLHFCNHIQRSALVALRNDDEGMLREIAIVLQKFGTSAVEKGLDEVVFWVAGALEAVGTSTADKKIAIATSQVVTSLEEVGISAIEKEMAIVPERVVAAIRVVGTRAVENGLTDAILTVADALGVIGNGAARKGMEGATDEVANALGVVGTSAAGKGLVDVTFWVARALGVVGNSAAANGLDKATDRVVRALCHMSDKDAGRDAATESLAKLLSDNKDDNKGPIMDSVREFESRLNPDERGQFASFMNSVKEELEKLESEKKEPLVQ